MATTTSRSLAASPCAATLALTLTLTLILTPTLTLILTPTLNLTLTLALAQEPYRRFLVHGDARQIVGVALANWLAVLILGALLGPCQLASRRLGLLSHS